MDNVLIFSEDGLSVIGCDKSYSGEIIIPEGVEHIANYAFYACEALTSIFIPYSVKTIGDCAFCRCFALTSIHIPDCITSIGRGAFSGCKSLTSINIPSSIQIIEDWTFSMCDALMSIHIPDGIVKIGIGAFNGCSNLSSIYIPDSIELIGESAFSCCTELASVSISNSVTLIEKCTFAKCTALNMVHIPDSVISIGDCAFNGCRKLTSVVFPNTVTSIGEAVFEGCTGLEFVDMGYSVKSIGGGSFFDCTGLTSIFIPNSINYIGEDAFYGCSNLKTIFIPQKTISKFTKLLPTLKGILVEQDQQPVELISDDKLLLFFDTETIGLPNDWDAPSSDITNWPRIVQISWIVSNIRGQIVSKRNFIVKPEGFSIPLEVSRIHGITTERALEEGEKINNILDLFLRDLQQVSFVIGHNISFDKNVVAAELYRKGGERHLDEIVIDKYVDMLETKPTICTMLSSTNYCRIPRYDNGYKWPKLSELYYKLFNKELVDAHDSSVDIQATFDCFWKLVELGVIASVDAEDTINDKETPIHHNKMRFTGFSFNSSVYNGYGESTSDFIKRLYTREWKLFASNETPQDLMFSNPNTFHVMDNGRGISGTYTLKDKDSLLLSIDGESFYLHCVYYNEEIIIFQFDQSNEHLLLYPKGFAFSSVRDIHEYLDRVKQYVNSQRKKARKEKAIELQNRVESLIKDITRTDVEISDKRVATLERELKQLASIVGQKEVEKYQSIIYKVIEDNNNRKKVIEEEKKKKEEEKKRKKAKTIKNSSISFVIVLYTVLWLTAFFNHSSYEWETCGLILLWSSLILFLLVIATIIEFKNIVLPNVAKYIHISFGIITIICSCIYMSDWSKFQKCFNDRVFNPFVSASYYASNEENPINDYHNFSAVHGDDYLNETTFHLFDKAVRRIISVQINHSEDLVFLQKYISHNKSGYYLQEAKQMVYFASDQLVRKAETLGDWKYIIDNAPLEYLSDAQREYARLDSIVWNDEELAYHNTKSLNSTEACEKFLKLFKKSSHEIEISNLCLEIRKSEEMRDRIDRLKKEKKSKKRHRFFWLNN